MEEEILSTDTKKKVRKRRTITHAGLLLKWGMTTLSRDLKKLLKISEDRLLEKEESQALIQYLKFVSEKDALDQLEKLQGEKNV